jgi:hypothetical protein
MSISTERAGSETVSTLFGPLPDQAALLGILNFLYDLRCSLLLVERVNASEDICEPNGDATELGSALCISSRSRSV